MNDKSANAAIYSAYYLTLVAYLVASYFSEYRVWGFNWWAYYPSWVPWGLFGLGVIAPVIVRVIWWRFEYDSHEDGPVGSDRRFYAFAGLVTAAESMYLRSIALDSTDLVPYVGLTHVYRAGKREQQYRRLLFYTTERFDAPGPMFQDRGHIMLSMGRFPEAAKAYRTALGKGLDSSYVQRLMEQYPKLEECLK